MVSREEIAEIFKQDQPKRSFWGFIMLIIVLIVAAICFGLIRLNVADVKVTENKEQQDDYIYFVLGLILSFLVNLLTTILWDVWLKRNEQASGSKKLAKLKNITDNELLESMLAEIANYDNNVCKEYDIDARLTRHTNDDLVVCSVTYSYKKIFTNSSVKFAFIRVKNDTESGIDDNQYDASNNNEFYYRSDERTIPEDLITNDDYKLTFLQINNSRVTAEMNIKGDLITYSTQLPQKLLKGEISIKYTVEYVMEKDSFNTFIFENPTYGVTCSFNYADLAEEIEFSSYHFFNSTEKLTALHQKDDFYHSYSEPNRWILPRSNFLFVWYKKK